MAEPPRNPAAPKMPMSLYPELLQAERATISAAPVRYDAQQQKPSDEEAKALQKKKDGTVPDARVYALVKSATQLT